MNRFIPDELPLWIRNDPKKRAEVFVYDQLKQQLDAEEDGWTVVYESKWLLKRPSDDEPKEGEADFLMAHSKRGVFVLEVKGGGVEVDDNGQWTSRDANKNVHKIQNPFDQVERNARHLRTKINELPNWKQTPIAKLGRIVVIPDRTMRANLVYPAETSPEMLFDKAKMGALVASLRDASRFWFGERWQHPRSAYACDTLASLAIGFKFDDSLGSNLALETREFDRLTDDQYRVIQSAAKNNRIAVWGGAGSGKTWLARKRAMMLHQEGFRTLIVCRSELLADYLASITTTNNDFVISAFRNLARDVFGVTPGEMHSLSDQDYAWKLVELGEQKPELRFDAIMVDEGQDFQEAEWVFADGLLVEKKGSVLYVFLDDNQQVYKHVTVIPTSMIELSLGDNVRTTRSIHVQLARFYRNEVSQRPLGPLGRNVSFHEIGTNEVATVKKVVSELIQNDQVKPDDIVVLTPQQTSMSPLNDMTLANGRKLTTTPKPSVDVLLSSIEGFKGLERAVVVLAQPNELPQDAILRENYCYIAYSRPRSHLVVIGNWSTQA
jgi:hypothetical protein